ncbi:hypothetical protein [Ignicoccus hospitalis]|uniref:Uncharacterized protein n=1 Tax=Ignicoccus hospitalis (strain KIN4/I / DSM 18386 / JCM 14125) TaxID=453591 RepID=A8ABN6_IGNH4|nr:hypothetical protein [Ignicoccus hospitalis]ABU82338.1 hypothetical protein Igni_1161 [Ignicoccus hospitalis KIN4/I]HIH89724.1 hypothetical protein [Desulfurococcaceae archaeon]
MRAHCSLLAVAFSTSFAVSLVTLLTLSAVYLLGVASPILVLLGGALGGALAYALSSALLNACGGAGQ